MKYFLGDSMNIMILLKKVSTRICLENVHENSPKYSIKNTVLRPNWQYKATIYCQNGITTVFLIELSE